MEQWANYFLATSGAAAALTGLIFVAVSLNLQRILSIKNLPNRALGSVILLINILLISSLCLVPKQSMPLLGCETLLLDVTMWVIVTRMDINMYKTTDKPYKRHYIQNAVFTQVAVLPYVVAGVCLLLKCDIGFYWFIPGITFSFIKSLLDSWVLLVEINR